MPHNMTVMLHKDTVGFLGHTPVTTTVVSPYTTVGFLSRTPAKTVMTFPYTTMGFLWLCQAIHQLTLLHSFTRALRVF